MASRSIDAIGRSAWKDLDDPAFVLRRALRIIGDVDAERLANAVDATLAMHFPTRTAAEVRMEPGRADRAETIARLRAVDPGQCVVGVTIGGPDDEVVVGLVGHQQSIDLPSIYRLLTDVVVTYLDVVPAEPVPEARPRTASDRTFDRRLPWWLDHLATALVWPAGGAVDTDDPPSVHRVTIERAVWDGQAGDGLTGRLPELALLTALSEAAVGRERGPIPWLFPLDLRQMFPAEHFVGPFSDRIVLALGGSGLGASPSEQLRQAHGQLLTAVMRYVPHDLTVAALRSTPDDRHGVWEFLYCPHPAESVNTRDDPGLARHGLSIELFAEPDLAVVGLPTARRPLDVVARFSVAEHDVATGARVVQVEYRPECRFGSLAPWALDAAMARLETA